MYSCYSLRLPSLFKVSCSTMHSRFRVIFHCASFVLFCALLFPESAPPLIGSLGCLLIFSVLKYLRMNLCTWNLWILLFEKFAVDIFLLENVFNIRIEISWLVVSAFILPCVYLSGSMCFISCGVRDFSISHSHLHFNLLNVLLSFVAVNFVDDVVWRMSLIPVIVLWLLKLDCPNSYLIQVMIGTMLIPKKKRIEPKELLVCSYFCCLAIFCALKCCAHQIAPHISSCSDACTRWQVGSLWSQQKPESRCFDPLTAVPARWHSGHSIQSGGQMIAESLLVWERETRNWNMKGFSESCQMCQRDRGLS